MAGFTAMAFMPPIKAPPPVPDRLLMVDLYETPQLPIAPPPCVGEILDGPEWSAALPCTAAQRKSWNENWGESWRKRRKIQQEISAAKIRYSGARTH
jgi:hypothetical protein